MLLHTFTHTAKALPPDQPKSQKTLSFWHSNLISYERVAAENVKSQKPSVLDTRTSFRVSFWHSIRAKGLPPRMYNRKKLSVFVIRTSFLAAGATILGKNNFWHSNLVSCERVAGEDVKSQKTISFWNSNLVSCEKIAPEVVKSQKAISFWHPSLISCERVAMSWHLVGTACDRRREKNKKERDRDKDKREREKMWRWEDKKMWRWKDVSVWR